MCLLDYNKKTNKYKHITEQERYMIERWHNKDKKSNQEIAKLLNKSERTIRREIKRGSYEHYDTNYFLIISYSAKVAQDKYDYNQTSKGQELKIGKNHKVSEIIEYKIKKEKKSPEVVAFELKNEKLIEITGKTIRNYIKSGILNIREKDLTYKKIYKDRNKTKRPAMNKPVEKSIEFRPIEANLRAEYGHWEGDLVIGQRKKGNVLLTFTERMTRQEIIIKIKGKKTEYVIKALNGLERRYGKEFYNTFKTITFDNGAEFSDYEGMEKSCLRKGKRTKIYYAHPYRSGERGTNENNNRMIRRWFPKGISLDKVTPKQIKEVEEWINNYPRAMFGYKSSNMLLLNV